MFGIGIATYCRLNGESASYLERCLTGIVSQTHSDYRVYLIGDRYENDAEFWHLSKIIPPEKLYAENLPVAQERDSGLTGEALWCCGGVNAMNTALQKMKEDRCEIYCHLDDDDMWMSHHLQTLADAYEKYSEAAFINTCAFCPGLGTYPKMDVPDGYNNLEIGCGQLCHSTASWRLSQIPYEYMAANVAADALMWERIRAAGLTTVYIPSVTVVKNMELSEPLR